MLSPGPILALGLALIHGFAPQLKISKIIPPHRWTSFAGGVSISYVFLEIFPELSHAQTEVEHLGFPLITYLENHVYILALMGLVVFYGLDILALKSRSRNQAVSDLEQTSPLTFWIHTAAFAAVNVILGYLLQNLDSHGLATCLLFFVAVALHLFVIDDNLREHHQKLYDRQGRWLLTAAIVAGAIVGQVAKLDEAAIAVVWSFVAGNIILSVLKRELPDERKSCFWSFASGAIAYAILLLVI